MEQLKEPGRPSWTWPVIAGWAAGVGSVDTQNAVTIKGSNKGESYERGAGKEKQANLFDLFEVLDMFMINSRREGPKPLQKIVEDGSLLVRTISVS